MNPLYSVSMQWPQYGIDATIKFSIVLMIACIVCTLLHRKSAAIRNRIWSLALVSGLVIPVATCFLPPLAIPILSATPSTSATSGSLTLDHALVPFKDSNVIKPSQSEDIGLSKDSTDLDSHSRMEARQQSFQSSALLTFIGSRGIIIVWLVGCIYFLTHLLLGCWQCRKLVKSAELVTDELSGITNESASEVGLRFPVETFVSKQLTIPLAIGLIRPAVILPNDAIHWSRKSQRFAILHELVHHERRDVAWQILSQTISAIYWFHPLVWYASHRMRAEREFACDDRVVQISNEATDYAQQLVEIARHASHAQFAFAVAMAQPSGLEQRIVAIFNNARCHLPLSKPFAIRWAIGMLVCTMALSVAKPVARAVQLDEKAKQPEHAVAENTAEYYVERYQAAVDSDPYDIALQLSFLEKAIAQDALYPDIYEKMVFFCQRARNPEEAKKIKAILEQMVIDGKSPALAHFALSSIYQIMGNKNRSEAHLIQSYRLDGKFPLVANNLAWLLADRAPPDLERANELALSAVHASPKDPRFRETLATIWMLQGKTHEAIAEFEAIIGVASDKGKVHQNLATLYRKIGDETLAEMHEAKANEHENNKAEEMKRKAQQTK